MIASAPRAARAVATAGRLFERPVVNG